jgi:hypothetical protein
MCLRFLIVVLTHPIQSVHLELWGSGARSAGAMRLLPGSTVYKATAKYVHVKEPARPVRLAQTSVSRHFKRCLEISEMQFEVRPSTFRAISSHSIVGTSVARRYTRSNDRRFTWPLVVVFCPVFSNNTSTAFQGIGRASFRQLDVKHYFCIVLVHVQYGQSHYAHCSVGDLNRMRTL